MRAVRGGSMRHSFGASIKSYNSMPSKQSAFTLLEMMIAMVIGLIILSGVIMAYLSSKQTHLLTNEMIAVNDNGRFAANYLTKDLQKAGWINTDINSSEGHSLTLPVSKLTNNEAVSGGKNSDSITIRYYGDADCIGTAPTDGVVENTYKLAATSSLPELLCNGASLIKNVESFQVLYGTLTSTGMQYVNSASLSDVSSVKTIKIAFTVASDNENILGTSSSAIDSVLDEGPYTFTDGRYRQLFSKTILLNNNSSVVPDSLLSTE